MTCVHSRSVNINTRQEKTKHVRSGRLVLFFLRIKYENFILSYKFVYLNEYFTQVILVSTIDFYDFFNKYNSTKYLIIILKLYAILICSLVFLRKSTILPIKNKVIKSSKTDYAMKSTQKWKHRVIVNKNIKNLIFLLFIHNTTILQSTTLRSVFL